MYTRARTQGIATTRGRQRREGREGEVTRETWNNQAARHYVNGIFATRLNDVEIEVRRHFRHTWSENTIP